MDKIIDGVILTPLKKIPHEKGDVFHGMKSSSDGYCGFGEAYFTSIHKDIIKGWKKHTEMVLNLVVIFGEVKFVIYDDRTESLSQGKFFSVTLSQNNYQRLSIPSGVWVAFQGISNDTNMILNMASIEHTPTESENVELEKISYEW